MPTRFASRKTKSFHWIPRDVTPQRDIQIDSVSVKTKIWTAEFTRAISPEIGFFKIILDNNNEEFSEVYTGGESVEFYLDYSDGTTTRFKGEIDTIKNKYDSSKGFTLEVAGNHVSGELLTITVTESFNGDTTCDAILKELIDEYLTGYTYDDVTVSTETPTLNWNNKPFWECVEDICKLAKVGGRFDCYVDDDKDFHFFEENSIETPNNEAIVWNDTMISTEGLGTQTLTQRNQVIVYGEAGGLPVINTTGSGNKQEVVFDSKVTTEQMALDVGTAEYALKNRTELEGKAYAFLLAGISPGQKIWISDPVFKIQGQYKIYKYTHKLPEERTECFIQTSRDVPQIFKKRMEAELALQTITNPYKMASSWNFTFDSEDEITTKDSNVAISESIIKLSSGVEGTFTATKSVSSNLTKVHLKVIGSALVGTVYKISTDGGENYQTITPESEINISEQGTNLNFKVEIKSAETEIDSLAILFT